MQVTAQPNRLTLLRTACCQASEKFSLTLLLTDAGIAKMTNARKHQEDTTQFSKYMDSHLTATTRSVHIKS